MSEKLPYPHIQCKDGSYVVRWGRAGWMLIVAILIMLGGSSLVTYRIYAIEEEDVIMQENIKIVDRNMKKIDEHQRIQASQTGLMVKQLNALLEKQGVTKRIEAPPIEPSDLEDIE